MYHSAFLGFVLILLTLHLIYIVVAFHTTNIKTDDERFCSKCSAIIFVLLVSIYMSGMQEVSSNNYGAIANCVDLFKTNNATEYSIEIPISLSEEEKMTLFGIAIAKHRFIIDHIDTINCDKEEMNDRLLCRKALFKWSSHQPLMLQ